MDELMNNFAEWAPLLIYCLCCYAIVNVIRGAAEARWPDLPNKKAWNPAALRVLPMFFGVAGAVPKFRYPFPAPLDGPLAYRLAVGGFLGFTSTVAYRAMRAYLTKKFGADVVPPELRSETPPEEPKP